MKELTIEQKAQRYDEAIKIAKNNYETIMQWDKDCTFAKEGIVNTFHRIFPELKESEESEDERIRKGLIKYFRAGKCENISSYHGISTNDILAWLEKQGEQKPVEWHRGDEQNLNACLGYIPDEFLRRWLTDIIHVKYDNPAWSEEDERKLQLLTLMCDETKGDSPSYSTMYREMEELKTWLNSLKDRYTWKPSDEQIQTLYKYAEQNNYDGAVLTSLYHDIKKL